MPNSNNKIVAFYEAQHKKFMHHFGEMFQVFQLKKDGDSFKRQMRLLNIQEGDLIIDAGCGIGSTAIELTKRYNCFIHGFNISDFHLNYARETIKQNGLANQIVFYNEDYKNIDKYFKAKSVDKIYFIESFNYSNFKNKQVTLEKCFSLLKESGTVFIQDFFFSEINSFIHSVKKKYLKYKISRSSYYFIEELIAFLELCEMVGFSIEYVNKMEISLEHLKEIFGSTSSIEQLDRLHSPNYHFFQLEPFEIVLKR